MTISIEDARRPGLPPAQLIEHGEVRKAVEAHDAAVAAARTAERDATALEQARPQAEAKDRDALADALQRGAKDPGTPAADAADEKIAAARRQADARRLIQTRAFAALTAAIDEHGDEWRRMAEERLTACREKWAAAVDALSAQAVDLTHARALVAFTRGQQRRYNAGGGSVPLRRTADHHASIDAVLAALRTLSEPPEQPDAGVITGPLKVAGAA